MTAFEQQLSVADDGCQERGLHFSGQNTQFLGGFPPPDKITVHP
jgi:hypothetical protein